jgi:hypothetical protein
MFRSFIFHLQKSVGLTDLSTGCMSVRIGTMKGLVYMGCVGKAGRVRCFGFLVLVAGWSLLGSSPALADLINTDVYSSFVDHTPNGVQFVGSPALSLSTPDFEQFGNAANNWAWHPGGLGTFAADSRGFINVPAANSFTFILAGAQTSFLFVDGSLATLHGSFFVGQNQTTLPLGAGLHSVEVQYEIVNGPTAESGYELTISPGNGFSFVAPEPSGVGLVGGFILAALLRRRRSGGHRTRTSIVEMD